MVIGALLLMLLSRLSEVQISLGVGSSEDPSQLNGAESIKQGETSLIIGCYSYFLEPFGNYPSILALIILTRSRWQNIETINKIMSRPSGARDHDKFLDLDLFRFGARNHCYLASSNLPGSSASTLVAQNQVLQTKFEKLQARTCRS